MAEKEYIEREKLLALADNRMRKIILALPAADVRPVVRATWVVKEMKALFLGMDEHPVFACSECGYQIYDLLDSVKERHHYCPNCGADMRPTSMSGANGEEI